MKSPNVPYLVGLDHLRAVAALLIVFYHGLYLLSPTGVGLTGPLVFSTNPIVAVVAEGHTAVGLFMVLSGFVFSVGASGRDVVYWPYIRNRLLRIYPLLVVLAAVGVAAHPSHYSFVGLAQSMLFQANLPGHLDTEPFSGMFWAVSVEFQFYLIFPFLHRTLEREGFRWAIGFMVLATLLRSAAFTAGSSNAVDISYLNIVGRIDQFLIGMLAARVYGRWKGSTLPWGLMSLGSIGLALAVVYSLNQVGGGASLRSWMLHWPTVEGLIWAAVIVSYVPFAERVPNQLSAVLARIGTWSYSIYLLNTVCFYVVPRYVQPWKTLHPFLDTQLYVAALILPVLLPVSALSYHVIERPFLDLRTKYLVDRKDPHV